MRLLKTNWKNAMADLEASAKSGKRPFRASERAAATGSKPTTAIDPSSANP
jgi:hypothetical protein